MNKKIICALSMITCLTAFVLTAEVGCIENSWHLKKYDNKEYHSVPGGDGGHCNCPCSKYMAQCSKQCTKTRWQCPKCKHYHVPRPLIIVRQPKDIPASTTEKTAHAPSEAKNIFGSLNIRNP